jgi:hypothetical protein
MKQRINRMNHKYTLQQINDSTIIKRDGTEDSILVHEHVETISQSWYHWLSGVNIQQAFPYLNADEREFLLTGITAERWNSMFNTER